MSRNLFHRLLQRALAALALVFLAPVTAGVASHLLQDRAVDWRTARRDSAGMAPDPATTPEAVVQVYAARAFRWRGAFGVHTWIAAKPSGARRYTRYEVMGFGLRHGNSAVRIHSGTPDAYWFGNRPELLRELRGGAGVDGLIERLDRAARRYPYDTSYRIWPGPNSNTFVAWLARELPELSLDLPPTAIGKDYLPDGHWHATAPSGRGLQISLGGLVGLIVAPEEGIELNLLGLAVGLDFTPPALKLPGLGRIGPTADPLLPRSG
ncbi:MAG: DUF3750 domain-containing protein [Rhodocyclaceae bacterium]|nr:DUF3750 domain-containing protein [Rhodocyclaceae bacterium]